MGPLLKLTDAGYMEFEDLGTPHSRISKRHASPCKNMIHIFIFFPPEFTPRKWAVGSDFYSFR